MSNDRKFGDLKKSVLDKKIAGVCGGFGEYTSLPSWMWRVMFVVSLFVCGLGVITYIVLWIAMPAANLNKDNEVIVNS
jgi:phage shock protein PspC (stress-responsive transcriptional regulator)